MEWRREGARPGRTGTAEFARGAAEKFADNAWNRGWCGVSCRDAFARSRSAGTRHEAAFEFRVVRHRHRDVEVRSTGIWQAVRAAEARRSRIGSEQRARSCAAGISAAG